LALIFVGVLVCLRGINGPAAAAAAEACSVVNFCLQCIIEERKYHSWVATEKELSNVFFMFLH